jgi:hypothetical protein
MKKLGKREKAHLLRRRTKLNTRRLQSKAKRKESRIRTATGADA